MNKQDTTKKVFLRSFGCQMNVRDSEVVKGLLAVEGYYLVEEVEGADVVLFNTCSVREHAEQRVWSAVGLLSRKKNRPLIGIIGCMAQNYKEGVYEHAPAVDIVCGPSEIDRIAAYVAKALQEKGRVLAVEERLRDTAIYHTGCDNYCTYCVVPYTRGRLRHRDADDILKEVTATAAAGIRNITLLGQNVNSYESSVVSHQSSANFVELLRRVSEVEGLKSVSFVTSHPKDTKIDLFGLMAERPIIRKYLHLPVQSGSDRVLEAMGRGYTVAHYMDIVEAYRKIVPDGKLSTDVIVGFPGETEADFEATRCLLERVRFDSAYLFKYSPRPHTKAADGPDDVPKGTKERRHAVLLEFQKCISGSKKRAGK
jgi:tRNA-2-methylthio-N6-dimethylallyladenosine synthase